MSLKPYKLIKYTYCWSIILISALPTESFFNIPLKIFATFFLIFSFIYTFYHYNIKISPKTVLSILGGSTILFLYTFWGIINFGYISLLESKLILSTFILTFIVYIFHTRIFSKYLFFKVYNAVIFFIFLIKITAYLYGYLYGGMEMSVMFYHLFFNSHIVAMKLPLKMYRLYLQTDIIAAFYPLILCWAIKEKLPINSSICIFLLIASFFLVLTSFSRYLIIVFLIGFFLYTYISKNLLKMITVIFLILLILFPFYNIIIELIRIRLHSSKFSDSIRLEQIPILINLFLKNPYIGLGFGAYNSDYIRSKINPFSYENQILSLLSKVGLIGMVIIFVGILYITYRFLQKSNIIGIITMFLFILSGWFNPYLYSSNVILIYTFILINTKT